MVFDKVRKRETEKEIKTERQKDRKTERQKDRKTETWYLTVTYNTRWNLMIGIC